MINVGSHEDDEVGTLRLFYTGDEVVFDRMIVKETRQSFDQTTNPLLSDFLAGDSTIPLELTKGGIFRITIALLEEKFPANYQVVENEVKATGILRLFLDADEVYFDDFYKIDKSLSTNDSLFLNKPVKQTDALYKVRSIETTVNYLTPLKDVIVEKVMNFNHRCSTTDKDWIYDALLKIKLIGMTPDFNKRVELYKSVNVQC